MTSLDDLLHHDSELTDRPPRPVARAVRWLLAATALAAALAAAVVLVLRAIGFDLAYPVPFAGWLALLMLRRLVLGVRVAPIGRVAALPEREPEPAAPDQLAAAVQRWQIRLSWGRAGIRPYRRLSPLIAELVDERLRLRHGLTLTGDPERARTLVGERLWGYLADPDARTPSRRDLTALLTDVERL